MKDLEGTHQLFGLRSVMGVVCTRSRAFGAITAPNEWGGKSEASLKCCVSLDIITPMVLQHDGQEIRESILS